MVEQPDVWSELGSQVQAAIVTGSITIASAILGFGTLLWQLRRQARNAIEANRLNEQMKLKKSVYEEVAVLIQDAAHAVEAIEFTLPDIYALGTSQKPLDAATLEWDMTASNKAMSNAKIAVNQLIAFTNRWIIIDERLYIFRFAFESCIYHMDVNYRHLVSAVIDRGNGGRTEVLTQFVNSRWYLDDKSSELRSYIGSFSVELQKLLLGDLFKGNVPVQGDPNHKLIQLDKHEELRRYFERRKSSGDALSTPPPRQ